MTTRVKKQNWSKEQVERLIALFTATGDYAEQKTLSQSLSLDKDFSSKTERAILGKVQHLSRSGVLCPLVENPDFAYRENQPLYIAKVYKTLQNQDVMRKSTIVSAIADILINAGKLKDSSAIDSLESCTKATLLILQDGLTVSEQEAETEVIN